MAFEPYLALVEEEIRRHVRADDGRLGPFYEMMRYHLGLDAEGGGKRLRPLLCLLVHEGLAGDVGAALPAAAALELLHNFTLIHDDIQDQDERRHHRATVWARWGVPQAINAGDGMYALSRVAVQGLRERGVPAERIVEATVALDRACVLVCEGQYLDISFEARTDVPADEYRHMVARKTGALFRASAEVPGILAGADAAALAALRSFGEHFGAAFQAYDDLKGVWAPAAQTGKAEMNDIAKRKMTLPLVLALERASAAERDDVAEAYARPAPLSGDEVRRVREIVDRLGVRAEVERYVAEEREAALRELAATPLVAAGRERIERLVASATGA